MIAVQQGTITFIDYYSMCVEAKTALPSKESEGIDKKMLYTLHNMPNKDLSDQGREFGN